MTAEHRDKMLAAVESPDGFIALQEFVKQLLGDGRSPETLLEDLSRIRPLVTEEIEDRVLDVMDLLVGWCAPEFRLVPPTES